MVDESQHQHPTDESQDITYIIVFDLPEPKIGSETVAQNTELNDVLDGHFHFNGHNF